MSDNIYIAPNATVVGDVTLHPGANIWYGAVLRGDNGTIQIGEGTNIQDNAVIHDLTTLGKYCTVGHGAILHGCTVGDRCLIGMGAIVLNGAVLVDDCLVAAGSLVTGKLHAGAGSLVMGNPARVVKPLTEEQRAHNLENAIHYVQLAEKTFEARKIEL